MPEMNGRLEQLLFDTQIVWTETEEPEVTCLTPLADGTACSAVLCTVQHDDTLYSLVASAIAHWNEVHRA